MWTSFLCVRVLNNTKTHAAEFAESQTLTSLLILAFMWASLATCTTDNASFGFQRMLLPSPRATIHRSKANDGAFDWECICSEKDVCVRQTMKCNRQKSALRQKYTNKSHVADPSCAACVE